MIFYFGSSLFSGGKDRIPYGTPQVVIVTVLDDATMSEQYRERVVENREYYAEMQGRIKAHQQASIVVRGRG